MSCVLFSVFGGHVEVVEVDAFHLTVTLLMGLKDSFQREIHV